MFEDLSIHEMLLAASELLLRDSADFNPEKAACMLEEAAERGSLDALEKLADCYFYGQGKDEDDKIAFEAYSKVLEINSSDYSAYQIGRMYKYGWGVDIDLQKAEQYSEQAWGNGFAAAAGTLGDICLDRAASSNDVKDIEEGLKWLQRAASKKDPYGMYRMALLYALGDYGIVEDKKRAYDLLIQIADYPRALAYLVSNNGLNICSNNQYQELIDKAEHLAIISDDTTLYRALGRAYEGNTRLGVNPNKTAAYYEMALNAGDGFAGYLLGVNYLYGWCGFEQNSNTAERYLIRGAEYGSHEAMAALGDVHKKRSENTWPRDSKEMRNAFEWYEKAYKNGGTSWDALHAGLAVFDTDDPSILERAAACLKYAMEDGICFSYVPLAKLSLRENLPTYDPVLARKALERARSEEVIEYKTGEVDYLTGLMFEKGIGYPSVFGQAVEFYLKASDKGSEDAKESLKRFKKGIFGWKRID